MRSRKLTDEADVGCRPKINAGNLSRISKVLSALILIVGTLDFEALAPAVPMGPRAALAREPSSELTGRVSHFVPTARLASMARPTPIDSGASVPWCDTPVYRYAMYQWRPAMFELYILRDSSDSVRSDSLDKAWREVVDRWRDSESIDGQASPNLMWLQVDIAADPDLNHVPAGVRALALDEQGKAEPGLFVVDPQGQSWQIPESPAEGIPASVMEDVVESPARYQIVQHLGQLEPCVLVMIDGQDPQQNQRTAELLKDWIRDLERGDIELIPTDPALANPTDLASDGQFEIQIPGLNDGTSATDTTRPSETLFDESERNCSLIQITADVDEEVWLKRFVHSLPHWTNPANSFPDSENGSADLATRDASQLTEEERNQPRVYAVLGRGRVLPPLVGERISRELLTQVFSFAAGACSCTIKDLNPGTDLLMVADWDTLASSMLGQFGTEEGNESLGDTEYFLPQLLSGTSPSGTVDSVDSNGDRLIESGSPNRLSPGEAELEIEHPDASDRSGAVGDAMNVGDLDEAAPTEASQEPSPRDGGFAWTGPMIVGIGLVVFALFVGLSSWRGRKSSK